MKRLAAILVCCCTVAVLAIGCANEADLEFKRYYSAGMLLYQSHCQNCHGKNGEGLSALIPPLTDTAYISKNKTQLACYVKNGVSGLMTVNGKFYDGKMPPSGLAPIDIANVLTYVGNSFGNKTGVINLHMIKQDLAKCK